MTTVRIAPDPEVVKRHNELFDLYGSWPGDPDDDPEFVAQAREIMGLPPLAEPVQAAAGHDITPGHDELHHYWTRGKGLAKWVASPHPWTTLYHHLLKYAPTPEAAKRWASKWFLEVMGFASGSDLNRVTHGRPPRGKRIGPG